MHLINASNRLGENIISPICGVFLFLFLVSFPCRSWRHRWATDCLAFEPRFAQRYGAWECLSFYSHAKVTALSAGGEGDDGSTCTAAQWPLDVVEVLSPLRLRGINHSPCSSESRLLFFFKSLSPPALVPLSNLSPKVDKNCSLIAQWTVKAFYFYFLHCWRDGAEVFWVILPSRLRLLQPWLSNEKKNYIKAMSFLKLCLVDKSNATCW